MSANQMLNAPTC